MSWICPHCSQHQVVTDQNSEVVDHFLSDGYAAEEDRLSTRISSIRCLNESCKKRTLRFAVYTVYTNQIGRQQQGRRIYTWNLIPESSAKTLPSYIPVPIREDYYEACRIRDLSPKASATLSRRCLQGMIRDFCGIARGKLINEIKELRRLIDEDAAPRGVDEAAVKAIDNVREIGNIGAHMEKDIGVIIDVDPDEAQILIELIESLFDEWYVARHDREQRFARLNAIAAEKAAAKKPVETIPVDNAPLAVTDLTPDG